MARFCLTLILTLCRIINTVAQSQEAQQLLLNYTKLQQLEKILDNMHDGYKILTKGYKTIRDISEGNFSLHKLFLDRLYEVNPAIRRYNRVADIIRYQKLLVEEYKRGYHRFRKDGNLTPDEIRYLASVYDYLVKQSLKNLEELVLIATDSKLRMNDQDRIAAIDRIFEDMQSKFVFVRQFNSATQLLIIQRARDQSQVEKLTELQFGQQ